MSDALFKLIVPPHTTRWFPEGEEIVGAVDGDLLLVDHGTWEDELIKIGQDALAITETDLHGYTWCAHDALVRGTIDGQTAVSEMGFHGYERRPILDYTKHNAALIHFDVSDEARATCVAYDEACEGVEYDWFEYVPFALDGLTGAKLSCAWGDTIICSTHVTMCLMGLGLFPDRPPTWVVPARTALWCRAEKPPTGNVATHVVLEPQTPETNPKEEIMSQVPFGIEDNQTSDVLFVFEDEFNNPTTAPTIDAGSLTATSSDTAALQVTPNVDLSGVTATAAGALDNDVVVEVAFTVGGVAWTGSETFEVGASAPTQLVLSPQTPTENAAPSNDGGTVDVGGADVAQP